MLEVGKIVNVHGIAGELKILTYMDSPECFCKLKRVFVQKNGEKIEYKIKSAKIHKGCVLAVFDGVSTRNDAEMFKNLSLFANRKEIKKEEGTYFIADLIGLRVISKDREIGVLTDIFQTGANDVFSVRDEKGKMYYIPNIPSVCLEKNINDGYILIELIDGLLGD